MLLRWLSPKCGNIIKQTRIHKINERDAVHVTQFKRGDEINGDISACGWGGFAGYVCASESALMLKPGKEESFRWQLIRFELREERVGVVEKIVDCELGLGNWEGNRQS
jgi:hypothetical protein